MTDSSWVKFRDQVEAILGIAAGLFTPIAAIVGAIFPASKGLSIVLRAIPALMAAVEEASPEPGTGPAKSAAVMKAAEDLMNFAGAQTTGGAKESFETYKPIIQMGINASIALVNKVAPKVIANDGNGINAPVDMP